MICRRCGLEMDERDRAYNAFSEPVDLLDYHLKPELCLVALMKRLIGALPPEVYKP